MPNIALTGHHHTCPKYEGKTPHVGGPVNSGQASCTVNGRQVAVVGDTCTCQAGGPDTIVSGSSSMTINGKPVAVVGSATAHGGVIVVRRTGSQYRLIGIAQTPGFLDVFKKNIFANCRPKTLKAANLLTVIKA